MQKNSFCICGFFHDYDILKETPKGLIEICKKCKDKRFFDNKLPSYIYLSYHLKQALQTNSKRFIKHYGRQHTI